MPTLLVLWFGVWLAALNYPSPIPLEIQSFRPLRLTVEVAYTPSQQARGLMFRRHLARDRGMLFIFATSKIHSFWMKNTFIDLDLLFLNEQQKVVGIIANAQAHSKVNLSIPHPSRFVVELPAGLSHSYSVRLGTQVVF